MTSGQPDLTPSAELGQRAAWRMLRERRRRVWRSVLAVVVATLLMLALLVVNRDRQTTQACGRRMAYATAALQESNDRGALPPLNLPWPNENASGPDAPPAAAPSNDYYYDAFFATRAGHGAEIGVACCRYPHTQLFGADGRYVIVFRPQDRKYELRWVDEVDFPRVAEDLGLRIP